MAFFSSLLEQISFACLVTCSALIPLLLLLPRIDVVFGGMLECTHTGPVRRLRDLHNHPVFVEAVVGKRPAVFSRCGREQSSRAQSVKLGAISQAGREQSNWARAVTLGMHSKRSLKATTQSDQVLCRRSWAYGYAAELRSSLIFFTAPSRSSHGRQRYHGNAH